MQGAGDRPHTSVDARADDPAVVIRVDEPTPGDRGDAETFVRLRRWPQGDDTPPQDGDADDAASDADEGATPKRLTIDL